MGHGLGKGLEYDQPQIDLPKGRAFSTVRADSRSIMKITPRLIVAAALSLILFTLTMSADSAAEKQLIQLVPKCDMNGDGS